MLPSACRRRSGSAVRRRPSARVGDQRAVGLATADREALPHVGEHVIDLDGGQADRQPALVEAGDHEQVLGKLNEAVRLLDGRPQRRLELLARTAPADRQLQLGLQHRERRAQLMAGVRANVRSRWKASSSRASMAFSV